MKEEKMHQYNVYDKLDGETGRDGALTFKDGAEDQALSFIQDMKESWEDDGVISDGEGNEQQAAA